jgi:FG-GAP-like repeat
MRPLRLLCLLTMLISTMKRAYFVSVFLCLTTTFCFAQLQLPLTGPRAADGASRSQAGSQRAFPLPIGRLDPGHPLSRPPFLPWDRYGMGSRRRFGDQKMRHDSSGSNPIFLTAPTYGAGGSEPYSVAVADVNADGKPDLVVANCAVIVPGCNNQAPGSVGILLGNGDGTFQAAMSNDSGGMIAVSVAVADVNGDGNPDLVVANYCETVDKVACYNSPQIGGVAVLFGNGDGTFQSPISYGSGGYYASSMAVADVNGDGKPDIVVANQCVASTCATTGSVDVLLGNGDGTFRQPVSYSSGGLNTVSVAVEDLNGDHKPDIVLLNEYYPTNGYFPQGTASVLLGNGDGSFQSAVTYASGGYGAASVTVADVDGNGEPDIVIANICADTLCTSSGAVGVLLNNGDGTFKAPISFAPGGSEALR